MKMEIGSEFALEYEVESVESENIPNKLRLGSDNKLVFLGRTAIDYVLEDITNMRNVKTVYFPSYCCKSMLEPFVKRSIKVIFYEVNVEKKIEYEIDVKKECDLFFAMSYFGFSDTSMYGFIDMFKKKGCIVIEDITHSLLNKNERNNAADYMIASLRKWFPLASGGIACKKNGVFTKKTLIKPEDEIIEHHLEGMRGKANYLKNKDMKLKETYLKEFKIFNGSLSENYQDRDMDSYSKKILNILDFQIITKKRQENAMFLYENLKKLVNIKLLAELKEGDCPLFFPILLEKDIREILRGKLIQEEIYCPVHWPRPMVEVETNIYDNEISLICDHRYGVSEMHRIVECIRNI